MEFENLIIISTRDKIIEVISNSGLQPMVAQMMISELLTVLQKECDAIIKEEYERFTAQQKGNMPTDNIPVEK